MTHLRPGMIVIKKPGGTEFIGKIVNVYTLPDSDEERMDVVSIAPGSRGLIHIYRPDQFRPATAFEEHRVSSMTEIWEGRA